MVMTTLLEWEWDILRSDWRWMMDWEEARSGD